MSWFSHFVFSSPSTAAQTHLHSSIRHDLVFAALSLCMKYNCHVDNQRVCMTRQYCIVPRLESHKPQESIWQKKKKKTFLESSQAVMTSLWSVSVCIRSSSHSPVYFAPEATGNHQKEGGKRRGRGAEHPSTQLRVLCLGSLRQPEGRHGAPQTSLYSSWCLHFSSSLVSIYDRGLSVPTCF